MTDEPDSLVLRYLRGIDAKVTRLGEDNTDIKGRLLQLENQVGHLRADTQVQYATVMSALNKVEVRLDRLERRAGLLDPEPMPSGVGD